MSQEDAFLRAILENSDDDTPRLVFADWLEEQGDPRGEFIRVQCELARLPAGDPRQSELHARERELLQANELGWLEPLRALLGRHASGLHYHRGFIEQVAVAAPTLVSHGDQLFRHVPLLRSLRIVEAEDGLDRLAQSPHLRRLTVLDLGGNRVGAAGAAYLARSPYLARLQVLRLNDCALGDEGLHVLARSTAFPDLTEWVLTDNGLTASGLAALADSPHFPRLAVLHFGDDALSPAISDSISLDDVRRLAASSTLTGLTTLYWHKLTDDRDYEGPWEWEEPIELPPGPRGGVGFVSPLASTVSAQEPAVSARSPEPTPRQRRVRLFVRMDWIW